MRKSVFSPQYELFRQMLVELRRKAGLSQRALAVRLGREHSFVARIEQGERRLDVVEFYWVCEACKVDPVRKMAELARRLKRIPGAPANQPSRPSI